MLQDGLHPSDRFRTLRHDNNHSGRPIMFIRTLRYYYNPSGRPVIIAILQDGQSSKRSLQDAPS